jgi:hypothetical protein
MLDRELVETRRGLLNDTLVVYMRASNTDYASRVTAGIFTGSTSSLRPTAVGFMFGSCGHL